MIASLPDEVDQLTVQNLIVTIQRSVAEVCRASESGQADVELPAPELAAALLNLLAAILETSPRCETQTGMRAAAGEMGGHLLTLMQETRRLRASLGGGETLN